MAKSKYEKYLTKNVVKENKWGGEGISLHQVPERMIPPVARMSLGITAVRKPYMLHEQTHKHSFTKFYYFLGSNPLDMHEFDAEIEFSFGAECEKQIISSPTIVTIPPGVYHSPVNFKRVGKPFYCVETILTSQYSEMGLGEDLTEIRIPEQSYKRFVTRGVVKDNKWGGEGISLRQVPEHIIPAGASMSLGITAVKKPYLFHEPTHKHGFTEFFFFFGSNPMDMNEFDADVELSFGAEREKQVISSPTIVTLLPGVYHCPLNYQRVGKPFYCLEAFLTSKYSGTDLEPKSE